MKIVTSEEMRALERHAEKEGIPTDVLMERAGLLAARKAWTLLGDIAHSARITVLVGGGKNGSDGLVLARHLQAWGAHVTSFLLALRPDPDPKLLHAIKASVAVWDASGTAPLHEGVRAGSLADLSHALKTSTMVVDAVLGTGYKRNEFPYVPLNGITHDALEETNAEREKRTDMVVFALDVPSGVESNSGLADPVAISADATITFGSPKIGLFQFPGASMVGEITVADIGIPEYLAEDIFREVITQERVKTHIPKRPLNAHKGTFGRVLALVGSMNYVGAAYLACMGSARAGSGYVTLAATPSLQALTATKLTEPTYLLIPEGADGNPAPDGASTILSSMPSYDVLLAGCGLGQHDSTNALLEKILLSDTSLEIPAVLDADALNTLARIPDWWTRLRTPTVITPHPGEMSRLYGKPVEYIERNRMEIAQDAAQRWGVTVVLKGAYTVVGSREGGVHTVRIAPFANPGLATAGTGDVLAGIIAGLIAQNMSPYDAAAMGVFIHGAAGEMVAEATGNTGIIASDLLPMLPQIIRVIREDTVTRGIQEVS